MKAYHVKSTGQCKVENHLIYRFFTEIKGLHYFKFILFFTRFLKQQKRFQFILFLKRSKALLPSVCFLKKRFSKYSSKIRSYDLKQFNFSCLSTCQTFYKLTSQGTGKITFHYPNTLHLYVIK